MFGNSLTEMGGYFQIEGSYSAGGETRKVTEKEGLGGEGDDGECEEAGKRASSGE